MSTTTRQLLQAATAQLQIAGCDAARLDAELLLIFCWQISRTELIINAHDTVPQDVQVWFQKLLQRRLNREPLAYILGEKEFWSRQFTVSPDVLIPRPETEHLIEAVLNRFPDQQAAHQFCDIGTGSGCIAVTLASEYPNASVVATDISEKALAVAQVNADKHAVSKRIRFRHGDMLAALKEEDGPFDALISNPPYVALHEMESLEKELSFEPHSALTDGRDGLFFLSTILNESTGCLKNNGYIMLETGLCALPETPEAMLLEEKVSDLAGHLRCGVYRLR